MFLTKVARKEATSSKKKRKGNIVLESLQRKHVEEEISDEALQRESQRMKEYSKFKYAELIGRRKREHQRLQAMRAAVRALPDERKWEVETKELTPVPFELPLFLVSMVEDFCLQADAEVLRKLHLFLDMTRRFPMKLMKNSPRRRLRLKGKLSLPIKEDGDGGSVCILFC